MSQRHSTVAALRERAAAGAAPVELATWLRGELGRRPSSAVFAHLFHQAFEVPLETMRRVEKWSGWDPAGAMTDTELTALLSPLRSRPADFDLAQLRRVPRSEPLPQSLDGPFVTRSYGIGHSRLVLAGDAADLLFLDVRAMQLRARFDRLVISDAADRTDIRDFADLPEPYDAYQDYLLLSDGEHEGFVVCGAFQIKRHPHEGAGR